MEEYESLQKLIGKDTVTSMEEVNQTSALCDEDTQGHLADCMSTPSDLYSYHNDIFTDMNGQQQSLSAPEDSIVERNRTAHCTQVPSEELNCHIQNMTGEISDIMDKPENVEDGETFSEPDDEEQCEKSFASEHVIDRQPLLRHPDTWGKQNQCKLCNKSFTERRSLNVHMIIHSSKKTHRCRLCGKSFAERSFNVHMLMHKIKKIKKCSITETRVNPEEPPVVRKKHRAVKLHLRTHTGEKLNRRDQCDKAFRQKCNLTKNLKIHSREKPFQCDQCKNIFQTKSDFARHLRKHSAEKPYQCDQCHKSFLQKGTLTCHLRTHSGGETISM